MVAGLAEVIANAIAQLATRRGGFSIECQRCRQVAVRLDQPLPVGDPLLRRLVERVSAVIDATVARAPMN